MSTYRLMANALLQQIKQDFDDSDVTINQVVYWINLLANRIKTQHLEKDANKKKNAYLVYFPNVKVYEDTSTNRKYSVLPEPIVNIDNDGGIDTVTYSSIFFEKCEEPLCRKFERTSPSAIEILCGDAYRKPSPSSVKFYRSKYNINGELTNILIYAGIECINVETVDMWLYTAESANITCNLDEEIGLTPDHESIVYYEVLGLARYGFLIQGDRKNDGDDTTQMSTKNVAPQAQQTEQ